MAAFKTLLVLVLMFSVALARPKRSVQSVLDDISARVAEVTQERNDLEEVLISLEEFERHYLDQAYRSGYLKPGPVRRPSDLAAVRPGYDRYERAQRPLVIHGTAMDAGAPLAVARG